jgi:hypothetical protein
VKDISRTRGILPLLLFAVMCIVRGELLQEVEPLVFDGAGGGSMGTLEGSGGFQLDPVLFSRSTERRLGVL